jgi:hypothetical protein
MKYPKLRDGVSPVGEAEVRRLGLLTAGGMPFAKTVVGDVSSYSRNGFPEVHQGQVLDGYYALGNLTGDAGPFFTVGSTTAKGKFGKRGRYDTSRASFFGITGFYYVGNGLMAVPGDIDAERYTVTTTPDAKRFKDESQWFYSYEPEDTGLQSVQTFRVVRGAYFKDAADNDKLKFTYGVNNLLIVDPAGTGVEANYQFLPMYHYKLDGEWHTGTMLAYPRPWRTGFPQTFRVAPKILLSYTPVYTPRSTAIETPPSFFTVSHDNGATWSFVTSDHWSVFPVAPTTVPGGPPVVAIDLYNELVSDNAKHIEVLPETATTCLVVMKMQRGDALITTPKYVVVRVNYSALTGTYLGDLPVNTSANPAERYDGLVQGELGRVGTTVFVQLFNRYGSHPHTLLLRIAGVWTQRLLPWAGHHVGVVTPIDDKTLVVPVYDGEHSLFESKDLALTWSKRAVLRTDAAAPSTDEDIALLTRFAAVCFVRKNNQPAPGHPGAPWVTDERVTP